MRRQKEDDDHGESSPRLNGLSEFPPRTVGLVADFARTAATLLELAHARHKSRMRTVDCFLNFLEFLLTDNRDFRTSMDLYDNTVLSMLLLVKGSCDAGSS